MKKKLLLVLLSIIQLSAFGQRTSGVKICVQDKKTGEPMPNTKVEILFNDSLKLMLQLDDAGCISKIDMPQGKYSVAVNINGYLRYTINGVLIGEGKIAYLTYGMLAIKDLTRKEKKQFGIK